MWGVPFRRTYNIMRCTILSSPFSGEFQKMSSNVLLHALFLVCYCIIAERRGEVRASPAAAYAIIYNSITQARAALRAWALCVSQHLQNFHIMKQERAASFMCAFRVRARSCCAGCVPDKEAGQAGAQVACVLVGSWLTRSGERIPSRGPALQRRRAGACVIGSGAAGAHACADATRMQQAQAEAQVLRAFVWVQDPCEKICFCFFFFFSSSPGKMKIPGGREAGYPGEEGEGGGSRLRIYTSPTGYPSPPGEKNEKTNQASQATAFTPGEV